MKESTNHDHFWGKTEEILYGDVWTNKSRCQCGAVRLAYRWCGKTSEEIRMPGKTNSLLSIKLVGELT